MSYLTCTGGLSAVVYTEVLQTVIMVGGAVTLSIMGTLSNDYGLIILSLAVNIHVR